MKILRELLHLLDVMFVNVVVEDLTEHFANFLAVEYRVWIAHEFLEVVFHGFTSVVENDSNLSLCHFHSIIGLINKMREGDDWNASTDEL